MINKSFERNAQRRATRIANLIQNLPADSEKGLNIVVRYYKEGGNFKVFIKIFKRQTA